MAEHTIKLNATGRMTLLDTIPDGTELHTKISAHGIMEPVPLTADELAALRGYADVVGRGTNIHWANCRARIRRESFEVIA